MYVLWMHLSSFNTQNVENMYCLFNGCSSLTTLDLSAFNARKVTNMKFMFFKCSSLTILNLSSLNNAIIVNNTFNIFDGCINSLNYGSSNRNILLKFQNIDS